ncbi:glycosyltransferase family 25 protein [Nitratireductor aestuarii]|uniref:glycosyltransferase family 25 protein n=1 Tax=Nitratireductor aestuarii TaxID=1735103 RepID=UPI001663C329
MVSFTIYKISPHLSDFEASIGVHQIEPIWGPSLSPQEFHDYMRPRVEAARRLLLPSELGCALSHVETYRRIVRQGQSGLILEDDIHLTEIGLAKVCNVAGKLINLDFLHLARYRHNFGKKEVLPGIYIADTSHGFWGTAAYLISPTMAQYLLTRHSEYIDLADNWQEVFIESRMIPYYSPVFDHSGEETAIGNQREVCQNPSLTAALRLRVQRRRMVSLAGLRFRWQTIRTQFQLRMSRQYR